MTSKEIREVICSEHLNIANKIGVLISEEGKSGYKLGRQFGLLQHTTANSFGQVYGNAVFLWNQGSVKEEGNCASAPLCKISSHPSEPRKCYSCSSQFFHLLSPPLPTYIYQVFPDCSPPPTISLNCFPQTVSLVSLVFSLI